MGRCLGNNFLVVGVCVNLGNYNGAGGLVSTIGSTVGVRGNGIIYVARNGELVRSVSETTHLISARDFSVAGFSVFANVLTNVVTRSFSIARVFISDMFGDIPSRNVRGVSTSIGDLRGLTRGFNISFAMVVDTRRDTTARLIGGCVT